MSVTVTLPDDVAALLAVEAGRLQVSADELAATLLGKDLREPPAVPSRPLLRHLKGMGASDGTRAAADIEDIMAATHITGRGYKKLTKQDIKTLLGY